MLKWLAGQKIEVKLLLTVAVSICLPYFLVVIPLIVFVVFMFIKKEYRGTFLKPLHAKFLIGFAAIAVISPVIFRNQVGILGGLFLLFVSFFILFAQQIMTRELYDKLIYLMCGLSFISFFIGLVQFIYEILFAKVLYFRAVSTFFNTNYYAFFIEIIIICAVYKLLTSEDHRVFFAAVIILNFIGAWISKNRSIWLSLAVGILLVMLLLKKNKAFVVTLAAVIAVVAVVLITPAVIPRFNSFGNNANTRVMIWRTGMMGILDYPFFGRGLWSYILLSNEIGGKSALTAHNLLLDPLLNFGFVGVSMFLGFVAAKFAYVEKRLRISAVPEIALVLGLTAAALVHNLADLPIVGIQTPVMLFMFLTVPGLWRSDEALSG